MNKFTALAGTGLLLLGSAGLAQDVVGPSDDSALPPEAGAPTDPATDPALPPEPSTTTDSWEPSDPATEDSDPADAAEPDASMPAPPAAEPETALDDSAPETETALDESTSPDAETAQTEPAGPDAAQTEPAGPETALSDPAAPGAGEAAFTDAEIQSFAAAALEIQNLPADANKQQQAAAIVADSGIDAQTFNAIGQAMQSNPDVAQRVQLAAASLQGQPEG